MPKKNEGDELESTEEVMPTPAPKKPEAPSLVGLVKMKKDDRIINAHPTAIKDHQRNGWKLVG
jgi:hypothetical protein